MIPRISVAAGYGISPTTSGGFARSTCLGMSGETLPFATATRAVDFLMGSPASAARMVGCFGAYMVASNLVYLGRRALLRHQTMRYIWDVRTTRAPGVSRAMYLLFLVAWQFLVSLYPLLEPLAWSSGWTCFFYSYPRAKGGGYILEPLRVQDLPANKRARAQCRLDWHEFKYNIGYVGRDGFRHPPSVKRNLPHFDIPGLGIKHWPWRRQFMGSSSHRKGPNKK